MKCQPHPVSPMNTIKVPSEKLIVTKSISFLLLQTRWRQIKWLSTTSIYYLAVLSHVYLAWQRPRGRIHSRAHACWQKAVSRGCRTEVPISLLALSSCSPQFPLLGPQQQCVGPPLLQTPGVPFRENTLLFRSPCNSVRPHRESPCSTVNHGT